MTENRAAKTMDGTAGRDSVTANGKAQTVSSEAVGARFPLRLLRPAARRLRAPHRINSIAVCRGVANGS